MARFFAWMLSVGLIVVGIGMASAQNYPSKPIRIVAGSVAGSTDFGARLIAQGLSGPLGQPVIVDNRVQIVAIETAAKAPPDGYTLLVQGSTLWTGPLLRKMSYDPVADFSSVTLLGIEPNILVVHPSVPAKSVKELIALAKVRPGELNLTVSSIGGSSHIAGELFKSLAGVNVVQVNYKSNSQEIADLITGQVHVSFQGGPKMGPYIKAGKLRALAVTTVRPSAIAPGLPTVAATVPGFESVSILGVFAPAHTPAAIIQRLNQEIVRVLNQPEVKQKFFDTGIEIIGSSPEDFANKIKSEMAMLAKVIKDAGIKLE